MADLSEIGSVLATCDAAAEQAYAQSTEPGALPVGEYVCRLVDWDIDTYTPNSGPGQGRTFPRLRLQFEVLTATQNPGLEGRKFWESFRCGPVFDDGSSPDLGSLKGMFRKLFREDPPDNLQMLLNQLTANGMGSAWRITVAAGKNGYTNTRIGQHVENI